MSSLPGIVSSMTGIMTVLAVGIVLVITLIGAAIRARSHAQKPPSANRVELIDFAADPFDSLQAEVPARRVEHHSFSERLRFFGVMARTAFNQHPAKGYGWAETIFWLLVGAAFVDYLIDANGFVGLVVWVLTIAFHEIGHIICNPFGEFIMFAGGSIWQVLTWILFTAGMVLFYRRISGALLCWAVTGFSLINLARYINDARARKLPLLFGLDSTHHDWWWLLSHTNLLPYDHLFASITVVLGTLITLSAIMLGIASSWLFPRVLMNQKRRFAGNLRQAFAMRWMQLVALTPSND